MVLWERLGERGVRNFGCSSSCGRANRWTGCALRLHARPSISFHVWCGADQDSIPFPMLVLTFVASRADASTTSGLIAALHTRAQWCQPMSPAAERLTFLSLVV